MVGLTPFRHWRLSQLSQLSQLCQTKTGGKGASSCTSWIWDSSARESWNRRLWLLIFWFVPCNSHWLNLCEISGQLRNPCRKSLNVQKEQPNPPTQKQVFHGRGVLLGQLIQHARQSWKIIQKHISATRLQKSKSVPTKPPISKHQNGVARNGDQTCCGQCGWSSPKPKRQKSGVNPHGNMVSSNLCPHTQGDHCISIKSYDLCRKWLIVNPHDYHDYHNFCGQSGTYSAIQAIQSTAFLLPVTTQSAEYQV